jgi:hypothetical protein
MPHPIEDIANTICIFNATAKPKISLACLFPITSEGNDIFHFISLLARKGHE